VCPITKNGIHHEFFNFDFNGMGIKYSHKKKMSESGVVGKKKPKLLESYKIICRDGESPRRQFKISFLMLSVMISLSDNKRLVVL